MKGFLSSKDIIFCLRKHWLILKVIKCTRSSSPLLSSWPYPYNLEVKGDETRRNRRSTCCKLLVMLKNKIYDLLLFLLPFILNMIWKTSPLNCLLRCKMFNIWSHWRINNLFLRFANFSCKWTQILGSVDSYRST